MCNDNVLQRNVTNTFHCVIYTYKMYIYFTNRSFDRRIIIIPVRGRNVKKQKLKPYTHRYIYLSATLTYYIIKHFQTMQANLPTQNTF